jgi:regulator of sirC expression with transglutaminase-like and TPR domain
LHRFQAASTIGTVHESTKILPNVFVAALLISAEPAALATNFISEAVEAQLTLTESKIDVGIAALTMAKEVYPYLDVQAYSKKLDALAAKAKWLARDTQDPEIRIRALNTVLFRYEGFRYDHEGFAAGGRKEHFYLNGILDTKQGICFTMPLLYVAVGQRLGWPIYPVTAPSHFFARYSAPFFHRQNIEVTSGGKYFEDEWYIDDFAIGPGALRTGGYMRTLTYREYLGHILYASAYAFRDGHKRLAYVERAAALDPRDPDFHYTLGVAYAAKSKIAGANLAQELQEKSRKEFARAKTLGYVSEEMTKVGLRVRGRSR